MSKKKRRRPARAPSKRQKGFSPIIPIVVAVVVLAVVVGVILSVEGGQSASAGLSGEGLSQADTAQPLATRSIPYPDVPRISVEEAQAQLAQGEAILIDVRSKTSYDKSHAAGAISFPEGESAARFNELPRDQMLILYCT